MQRRMFLAWRNPCCSPSNMHSAVGMPLVRSASYIACACTASRRRAHSSCTDRAERYVFCLTHSKRAVRGKASGGTEPSAVAVASRTWLGGTTLSSRPWNKATGQSSLSTELMGDRAL